MIETTNTVDIILNRTWSSWQIKIKTTECANKVIIKTINNYGKLIDIGTSLNIKELKNTADLKEEEDKEISDLEVLTLIVFKNKKRKKEYFKESIVGKDTEDAKKALIKLKKELNYEKEKDVVFVMINSKGEELEF